MSDGEEASFESHTPKWEKIEMVKAPPIEMS